MSQFNEIQLNNLVEEKVFDAIKLIQQMNFFYFYSKQSLRISVVKNLKHIGQIGYNPKNKKFYMLLQEKAILEGEVIDIAGLIQHELSHLILGHVTGDYIENKFGFRKQIKLLKDKIIESSEEDKNNLGLELLNLIQKQSHEYKLLNQAQDYIINENCSFITERYQEFSRSESKSILKNGCFYHELTKNFPELEKSSIDSWTSISLYNFLREKISLDNGKSNYNMDSYDESIVIVDDLGVDGIKIIEQELSEAEENKLNKEIESNLESQKNQLLKDGVELSLKNKKSLEEVMEKLPASIRLEIENMYSCQTDKNYLHQFVRTVKQQKGYRKTWSKLHKKYPYAAKAKINSKKPNMVMGLDSSGSMLTPELKEMMAYQICELSKSCDNLWVVVGDTELKHQIQIKSQQDFSLDKIKFIGGGFTSLQFMWDFAKEKKADGLIVNTDGYIDPFDSKGVNTLFFIYPKGIEVNGFKNIKVYPKVS